MELTEILNSLSEAGQEKTASEAAATKEAAAENLDGALAEALAAAATEKVASSGEATPSEDLTKIAERLAGAEQEALVKEAEMYGAALCDGFMARMNSYEQASGGFGKTASVTEESFTKFASDNPELVKNAMDLGYRETKAQLEKVASSAYEDGYEKTAEAIKLAAEDCATTGFQHATNILASLGK
jgi:hypothetical protein